MYRVHILKCPEFRRHLILLTFITLKREVAPLRVSFFSVLRCVIINLEFYSKVCHWFIAVASVLRNYFCFGKLFYCGLPSGMHMYVHVE